MKDAYGGTMMLYLFMIFFLLYVSIIGVALNFAKIYRIKNNVINILEQYQYNGDSTNSITLGSNSVSASSSIKDLLEDYLDSVPYNFRLENYNTVLDQNFSFEDKCPGGDSVLGSLGLCVIQKGDSNTKNYYYDVTVYHVIELPILNISIPITAKGETKVIKAK